MIGTPSSTLDELTGRKVLTNGSEIQFSQREEGIFNQIDGVTGFRLDEQEFLLKATWEFKCVDLLKDMHICIDMQKHSRGRGRNNSLAVTTHQSQTSLFYLSL